MKFLLTVFLTFSYSAAAADEQLNALFAGCDHLVEAAYIAQAEQPDDQNLNLLIETHQTVIGCQIEILDYCYGSDDPSTCLASAGDAYLESAMEARSNLKYLYSRNPITAQRLLRWRSQTVDDVRRYVLVVCADDGVMSKLPQLQDVYYPDLGADEVCRFQALAGDYSMAIDNRRLSYEQGLLQDQE